MTDEGSARVYFDTTIFLSAFEGTSAQAESLQAIFNAIKTRPKRAVTSELTLAELFGKESALGWATQKRLYLDLIVFSKAFDLRSVTRSILIETGDFRQTAAALERKIKLPDAIHIVTAIEARCRYVFTQDKRFPLPTSMTAIAPDAQGCKLIERVLSA